MNYAIDLPAIPTLAVAGRSERFPVHRVFCVGRNYAAHTREMGKDPDRESPFFFMKPANAVVDASGPAQVPYPPKTQNYHHDIAASDALAHVYGYAVGLDMTRRDLQLEARDKGRPWEFGKSFTLSAPIGALHRAADIGHPHEAAIKLLVNGQPRQSSDIAKLIWSVAECLAYLSAYETLEPGDLVMTGTPEGVGAVVAGDLMQGSITGLGQIEVRVV
jgi:fumarylpyruvate hydrolase